MNATSAELLRGFSTTAPETRADAGTAPVALAPSGVRGAASIRTIPGGPADPADADAAAGDGGNAAADMTSSPSKEAIRSTPWPYPIRSTLWLYHRQPGQVNGGGRHQMIIRAGPGCPGVRGRNHQR
jgi:hypothetical protein